MFSYSHLTGRGVKVAVVDSGVDAAHPKVGPVAGGVSFTVEADGRIVQGADISDCAGHGTACAGIIRKGAPDAEVYSVRIFDASLGADGRALVSAIRWAVAHRMDVVNLSLGTTDVTFREAVAEACREAVEAGVILVAAAHNDGRESYPAVLPEAIGVAGGRVYDRYGYFYRSDHAIECVARGDEQRLCWLEGREIMAGGSSFAAPTITAVVALIREAHPGASLPEVRRCLRANALDGRVEPILSAAAPPAGSAVRIGSDYGWIGKAALYPYCKEMHALIRFRDLLRFQIVGVADPVGKGLAGKDAGEAIGIAPVGIRVAPRLEDAFRDADTLILGYVDALGRIRKRDLLRASIRAALDRGLNVFSFLAVPADAYGDLHEAARQEGLRIAYPDILWEDVRDSLASQRAGGGVDVPVLGIFGTSAQQGKFTLQLALRRKLMQMGYSVGQIGTEHHAALFGMDLAFPIGYAAPQRLPLQYYLPYLDCKMQAICQRKRPDIILVGAQSGTIPYDVHEPRTLCMSSLAFLLGAKPDACILVVNSIDADAYIRDTIDGIRAVGKAPALLLAMSDKEKHIRAAYGRSFVTSRQMAPQEIAGRLRRLEQTFGLPAVAIASEEGQQRAVETVVRYFSEEKSPCQKIA